MGHVAKSSKSKSAKTDTNKAVEDNVDVIEDATPVGDQTDTGRDLPDGDSVEDAEIDESAPAEAPEQESEPTPEADAVPRRRGFGTLLIGGLLAGGIGYGVETYFDQAKSGPDVSAMISDQADRIDAIQADLEALPDMPDLSPIVDRIASLETALAERLAAMDAEINDTLLQLDERLTEIEKRPGSDGTLSDAALGAYERELDELRAQLQSQRDEVMSLAEQAEADLEAARAETEQAEIDALVAARTANARAALNRVVTAIDTGEPFSQQLPDLEVALDTLPAGLTSVAEDGVASLAELGEAFAPSARAALAAARDEGVAEEGGGIGSFFRSQFDIRSTTPREGTDPDAILSRAQAAVDEGRLGDALAEVATLPEISRAEMTDWTAKAQARVDALDAVATLSDNLNEN